MQFQVFKIHSDFYYLKDLNGTEYVSKLRDVLKKQKVEIRVGDFVELDNSKEFIVKLISRKNFLNRPKVANIDLAIVICSLKEPDLDLIQLNRYLIYLKYHNIKTAICFNKEDLDENIADTKEKIKKIYEKLGYTLFFISAKNNQDLDDFKDFIKNKIIVLTGQSGVGKSTLINSLIPNYKARTSSVSTKTQHGCHTTRHCEITSYKNYNIIDTPGFSCLKFNFMLPNELIELFDDLKIYKNYCKYNDCLHNNKENSTNCGIISNLDKIDSSRYESYLLFLNETLEYKKQISKKSIKQENFKKNVGDKVITKLSKRKRQSARNTINQKIEEIENE